MPNTNRCPGYAVRTGSRRDFLWQLGGGLGGIALSSLLKDGGRLGAPAHAATDSMALRPAHHAPKAKAVIQIFCPGGLSHVDTWDYKPELEKRTGKPFDTTGELEFFASKPGNCQGSFWKFRQHGECGKWMSDLFPKLSTCVDDMAFIHSMTNKTALHGPACFMMNSGFTMPGFPAMGAWVTYGLGTETQNLPSFVVLPDVRGLPPGGPVNWGAGFLPAVHQATTLNSDPSKPAIADLFPPEHYGGITTAHERQSLNVLQALNNQHAAAREEHSELEARIASYELAARLQLSAPEVTDIASETEAIRRLYNLEHKDIGSFGRQCLMARRLVERGVRFVQLYCGAENTTAKEIRPNWDSHEDLPRDHGYWGPILDTGASALLKDLKSHGMLDDTLVMCTTEFGRQPGAQAGKGRDHNPGTFTMWMAGGGVKPGVSYGQSDDLGFQVAENPTYSYDLHATALHLLGIDHEKLTYYHNGIERRLTDVHGHVIGELLG